MTEKLGVLLVDVPEPRLFKYHSLVHDKEFFLDGHDEKNVVKAVSYLCTREEAKNTHSFYG